MPLFANIDARTAEFLIERGRLREYRKHTFVVGQDDESDSAYFVCEGKVRIFRDNEHGDEVTLSANGLPIARGEVVDIEGELGVRVLRLVSGRGA